MTFPVTIGNDDQNSSSILNVEVIFQESPKESAGSQPKHYEYLGAFQHSPTKTVQMGGIVFELRREHVPSSMQPDPALFEELQDKVRRGERPSVSLEDLEYFHPKMEAIKFIIEHSIPVESQKRPDTASLVHQIISAAKEVIEDNNLRCRRHKTRNIDSLKIAISSKKRKADQNARDLFKTITEIEKRENLKTDYEIARELNQAQVSSPSGKGVWQCVTVKRVRARIAKLDRELGNRPS